LRHLGAPVVPRFSIGRYEVTNREYKRFVDAGGYRRRELWATQFLRGGKAVSWDSAMKILVDRTGRPGPATWEVGSFATGEDEYPVTGVSFYEAQAYAAFAGLQVPTVYHWSQAGSLQGSAFIIPASNIARDKLAPVGRFPGVSASGAFDMAGNAREWVSNAAGDNGVLMGGGYDDLAYMFLYPTLRDRFDRSPTNGFRVARYDADSAQRLTVPITMVVRDYAKEKPASDEVFNVYRRLFRMDVAPERPTVVAADTMRDAIRERVSIRTRLTDDAMLIDVYRPRSSPGTARLPTLLFVPGSDALAKRPSPGPSLGPLIPDFVRSGRLVVVPILKGEWERSDSLDAQTDRESNFYRDRIVLWGKEFRVATDYLVTRADVDSTRIGYMGMSMGGRVSPILTVLEPRIKAAVLVCPGLALDPTLPEIDPFHYLPRMRIPTLMVGGRLDSVFPLDIAQVPFFNGLGASPDRKKHVVVDAGHCPSRQQFLREALPWLDKYLE
jgi:acetyl esterase/lipase